jgi:hypothetical protein
MATLTTPSCRSQHVKAKRCEFLATEATGRLLNLLPVPLSASSSLDVYPCVDIGSPWNGLVNDKLKPY